MRAQPPPARCTQPWSRHQASTALGAQSPRDRGCWDRLAFVFSGCCSPGGAGSAQSGDAGRWGSPASRGGAAVLVAAGDCAGKREGPGGGLQSCALQRPLRFGGRCACILSLQVERSPRELKSPFPVHSATFFLLQIPAWAKPGELRLDLRFPLLQRISGFPLKVLVQCNECFYKVPADLCQRRGLPCWVALGLQEYVRVCPQESEQAFQGLKAKAVGVKAKPWKIKS